MTLWAGSGRLRSMNNKLITPVEGATYIVHHSGCNRLMKYLGESTYEGSKYRRAHTHYVFLNTASGREVIIKSRVKILRLDTEKDLG